MKICNVGVIFDFDGVLGTAKTLFAIHDAIKSFANLSKKEGRSSMNTERAFCLMEQVLGHSISRDLTPINTLYRHFAFKMSDEIGIRKVCSEVQRKLILSNSSFDNINSLITNWHLSEHFGCHNILSAQLMPHLKPHPETLFSASSYLGLPPNRCVLVDDNLDNLVSAKRCGFLTFGYLKRYKEEQKVLLADKMRAAELSFVSDDITRLLDFCEKHSIIDYNLDFPNSEFINYERS